MDVSLLLINSLIRLWLLLVVVQVEILTRILQILKEILVDLPQDPICLLEIILQVPAQVKRLIILT